MRPSTLLSALLLCLALASGAARAAPSALAAVGLITRGDLPGFGCSGTLIAPDLVVTAAHCVAWLPAELPTADIAFHPTGRMGTPLAGIEAQAIFVHPGYKAILRALPAAPETIARDLALIRLARPVPPDQALPMRIGPAPEEEGARIWLASYRGQIGARQLHRPCPFRRQLGEMIELDCQVRPGESGGAMLVETPLGTTIFGTISSRWFFGGRETALGPDLGPRLAQLATAAGIALPRP